VRQGDTIDNHVKARIIVAAGIAVVLTLLAVCVTRWRERPERRFNARSAQSTEEKSETQAADRNPPENILRLDRLGSVGLREVSDALRSRPRAAIEDLAAQVEKLRPGSQRTASITQFFKAWAEIDPIAAERRALKYSDPATKEIALNALIQSTTPEAAGELAPEIAAAPERSLSSRFRSDLLGRVAVKWSEHDAAAAAQFLDQHPDAAVGMQGVPLAGTQIALNWATTDPQAAVDWASKQQDGGGALQGAVGGWWEKDPDGAAQYVIEHLGAAGGPNLASIIASRMALQDPQKAAEWAAQLPPEARMRGDSSIAFAWSRRDPAAASGWATQLPENERGNVLGPVASQWALSDPQAAGEWLKSLDGAGRDEAVGSYSSAVSAIDPTAALDWAMTMKNQRMRDSTMRDVMSRWYNRDPEAAKQWLATSPLSADEKSRLLDLPPGRG
jgi:hypothetical protein